LLSVGEGVLFEELPPLLKGPPEPLPGPTTALELTTDDPPLPLPPLPNPLELSSPVIVLLPRAMISCRYFLFCAPLDVSGWGRCCCCCWRTCGCWRD